MAAARKPEAGGEYEAAKRLARDPDPQVRQALAMRGDVAPEILYYLAADTAAAVRGALAGNPATPGQADLLLARDGDPEVRHQLVRKVVAKLPENGAADPGPLEKFTLQVLAALAADTSVAVRQLLSDALKDLQHAPAAVVRTLARDRELAVAEPVLSHSPQLSDEDLLAIVRDQPIPGALGAIARRGTVSHRVADAIARTDDIEAIAVLLGNSSAQIREETLDQLLERAPRCESWHRPLVQRPKLPGSAIRKLAQFVAVSLVEVLQRRPDLDAAAATEVAGVLRDRIERGGAPALAAPPPVPTAATAVPPPPPPGSAAKPAAAGGVPGGVPPDSAAAGKGMDAAIARAQRLMRSGRLGEDDIDDAIFAGDRDFVVAGLAQLAGLPEPLVDRILKAQSARGVVALVWKAKQSMRLALKLQLQIAHIPPKAVLNARGGMGFPLTPEEMAWQLEFFGAGR